MSSTDEELTTAARQLLQEIGLQLNDCKIVQTLWQGYGYVCRLEGVDTANSTQSWILKYIKPPQGSSDRSEGHIRKIISYEVEQYFYSNLAPLLRPDIAVAKCRASVNTKGKVALLLEDLRERFPTAGEKRAVLNATQVYAALDWLAKFHGFWQRRSKELREIRLRLPPLEEEQRSNTADSGSVWLNGGYTYLATRRSELDSLRQDETSEWSKALLEPRSGTLPCIAEQAARVLSPGTASRSSSLSGYETLVHGDVKSENLFTTRSGEAVAFFDFQYVGLGCGLSDLAKLFTCSVHEDMLHEHSNQTHDALDMGEGERALLDAYRNTIEQVSTKPYPWDVFKLHWQTALVDWLRFQASWGFWGNTEWLEARARHILADREWTEWLYRTDGP